MGTILEASTMRAKLAIALVMCLLLVGCVDSRIKREANLLNEKTKVATREYNAAPTSEEKLKVADNYFVDAQNMTQIVTDGLSGNPPTPIPFLRQNK